VTQLKILLDESVALTSLFKMAVDNDDSTTFEKHSTHETLRAWRTFLIGLLKDRNIGKFLLIEPHTIPLADMATKLIALNGCAYGVMALGNAWIGVQ
jgi:hypothetical protein